MTRTKKKTGTTGRPSLGHEDDFYKYGGKPVHAAHGELLYNAKKSLYVPVKQKHIEGGKNGSPTECVMARAVSDFFDDRYTIEIGNSLVRVIDNERPRRLIFTIPQALRRRLRLFDKLNYWSLPPALYTLAPAKRIKRTKAGKAKRKIEDNRVGTVTICRKPKKTVASPTRMITRGRIVR
jgi:hypothetical protein